MDFQRVFDLRAKTGLETQRVGMRALVSESAPRHGSPDGCAARRWRSRSRRRAEDVHTVTVSDCTPASDGLPPEAFERTTGANSFIVRTRGSGIPENGGCAPPAR